METVGVDWIEVPIYDGRRNVVARAKVDKADADTVLWYRWHLTKNGYAEGNGNVLMHRLILRGELRPGRVTDHANQDKLDNRRSNLRVVAPDFNNRNVSGRRTHRGQPTTSQYRGVYKRKNRPGWRAKAGYKGTYYELGSFASELEAAEAVRSFWRDRGFDYAL